MADEQPGVPVDRGEAQHLQAQLLRAALGVVQLGDRRSRPGRTTRSAECIASPCSVCSMAISDPSWERSPTPADSRCR